MADDEGNKTGTISYESFGSVIVEDNIPTDKKFTGQRLDQTGLYYYGARYYDPVIGRFISPDTIVQDYTNPQALNRYSYCINNPLKYVDPTGKAWWSFALNALRTVAEFAGFTAAGEYASGSSWDEFLCSMDPRNETFWQDLTLYAATAGVVEISSLRIRNFRQLAKPVSPKLAQLSTTQQKLQELAHEVDKLLPGNGPVKGIVKHTLWEQKVLQWNNKLRKEVSFLNGKEVKYGKKGSTRVDILEVNADGTWTVWDLKTGDAILDWKRIQQIKSAISPDNPDLVSVFQIK